MQFSGKIGLLSTVRNNCYTENSTTPLFCYPDLRHQLEKVKCRKLSKDEKKVFFAMTRQFIEDLTSTPSKKDKESSNKRKPSSDEGAPEAKRLNVGDKTSPSPEVPTCSPVGLTPSPVVPTGSGARTHTPLQHKPQKELTATKTPNKPALVTSSRQIISPKKTPFATSRYFNVDPSPSSRRAEFEKMLEHETFSTPKSDKVSYYPKATPGTPSTAKSPASNVKKSPLDTPLAERLLATSNGWLSKAAAMAITSPSTPKGKTSVQTTQSTGPRSSTPNQGSSGERGASCQDTPKRGTQGTRRAHGRGEGGALPQTITEVETPTQNTQNKKSYNSAHATPTQDTPNTETKGTPRGRGRGQGGALPQATPEGGTLIHNTQYKNSHNSPHATPSQATPRGRGRGRGQALPQTIPESATPTQKTQNKNTHNSPRATPSQTTPRGRGRGRGKNQAQGQETSRPVTPSPQQSSCDRRGRDKRASDVAMTICSLCKGK